MKYLRRGVWYVAGRLLILCLVLGIAVTVFYYAMNLTNIQIVLKDGMAGRVKVIMGMETDVSSLNKYFLNSCIAADEAVAMAQNGNSTYADYNVRGIDHRMNMGFMWTWPWATSVQLTITEQVPRIDGRVKGTRADAVIAQNGSSAVYPPAWPDAEYQVNLVRENGQWKIRSLTSAVR